MPKISEKVLTFGHIIVEYIKLVIKNTQNTQRMNLTYISKSAVTALVAAILASILVLTSFFMLEPTVGRAATDTDQFVVDQVVTAEISFLTDSTTVTMSPSLASLTGGRSSGTTTVRVNTNNSTGYFMTIQFSSTTAMGRDGFGGSIRNYNPTAAGVPDLNFGSEVYGQFAYTVIASTSADLDTSFRDDGAACNTGSNNTAGTCWLNPTSTVAETIINRTTSTAGSGATTSIAFRVDIPSNPVPAIPTGTYTATATLTATTN